MILFGASVALENAKISTPNLDVPVVLILDSDGLNYVY